MLLRSSAALRCREESGRSRSAAAKATGEMGVVVEDMIELMEGSGNVVYVAYEQQ